MKKAIASTLIAAIIVVVGPDLYAAGADGKKGKNTLKATTGRVIEKVVSTVDNELNLENWMKEISAFRLEETMFDESLRMEDWMMDVEAFEIESAFMESEIVMEDWMTEVFETEFAENELAMENWMLQPFVSEAEFEEAELELESWMYRF